MAIRGSNGTPGDLGPPDPHPGWQPPYQHAAVSATSLGIVDGSVIQGRPDRRGPPERDAGPSSERTIEREAEQILLAPEGMIAPTSIG